MFDWHSIKRAFAFIACACMAGSSATAAELKISYKELSGIVQAVLGDAKLHLHNKPAGIFDLSTGSYFAIAGKQFELPLPLKSFNILGSTYAYYVDDLNSQTITAEPVQGAVRLRLTFDPKTILGGTCLSGDCGLTNALPQIIWRGGAIAIDVVPVHVGLSLALQVKRVSLDGTFSVSCSSGGVFSTGACKLASSYARRTVARLKPEVATQIKEKANDATSQGKVADGLKKYLEVGQAGTFDITSVVAGNSLVHIAFTLVPPAGG